MSWPAPDGSESDAPPRRSYNGDLRPLDMDELEPLPPSEAHGQSPPSPSLPPTHLFREASASSSSSRGRTVPAGSRRRSSAHAEEGSGSSNGTLAARYVTVSAVLSRSGAAIPLSDMNTGPLKQGNSKRRRSSARKTSEEGMPVAKVAPPARVTRRKTFGGDESASRREASNGSALEALSALLLQRDSSGKVSNLSFTRYRQQADSASTKGRRGLSSMSKAWLQGVTEASAFRLGIRMPQNSDGGQTIAQRRARRQGFLFQSFGSRDAPHEEAADEQNGQSYVRVGTTSWHPTYEVGRPRQQSRHTILPPAGAEAVAQPTAPKLVAKLPPDLELSPDPFTRSSVFGVGSAFALNDPPDAPPSPVAMPGAWAIGGPGWSRRSGDWREEGALLLPPPLLDDQGSDAKSFEGLLGVRRMREQERERKQLEKLKARNRPAHKIGMLTAFSNFVKAAHAADRATKAASRRPVEMLSRRHTEPMKALVSRRLSEDFGAALEDETSEEPTEDEDVEGEPTDFPNESLHMRRSSSQVRTSLDTVYEARGQNMPLAQSLRRSSQASSSRSSLHDSAAPRAPRLLPIHMTITSPSTPFALDQEESYSNVAPGKEVSAPPTPRLGPTLLSLPPSPWTHSVGDEFRSGSFSMHLSMAPIHGPPGTPRLAPTALEVAPSPFPTSPALSPFARSPPLTGLGGDGQSTPGVTPGPTSPFSLSPRRSPSVTAVNWTPSQVRSRRTRETKGGSGDGRMTPLGLMDEVDGSRHSPRTGRKSDPRPSKRSFLLWFLLGDLGLGTRSTIAAKASGAPLPARAQQYSNTFQALLDVAAHVYGFSVFVLAHLVDLGYRIVEFLSMTFWFLRWMALNLTGQTVLARCVIDAYRLVQREWQTVSRENHEDKGIGMVGKATNLQGLSRWQVMKGMIELICLQDVTRERFHEEGAGLEELHGWKGKRSQAINDGRGEQRVDLGVKREADRRALSSLEADGVELGEESEGMDSESEGEGDDSDNDEMVVTRQGPEILEFTKTPRIEPRGYFSQAEDSLPKVRTGDNEANRLMVKTIKWASRLAISAYGLHVTLVDLPATFTPSGNRFSRQTFAHLSRLHHEDVLHADIQTLDSDAYSPTFYLVRDLSRRVVVVSVRGTQSLQDIIVDLEMVVDEMQVGGGTGKKEEEKLYCHAGVLRAAKALISRQSTLFKTLGEALKENSDFGIVFTGHSLGGAIASTVALLLSEYVQRDDEEIDQGEWVTHAHSGLPAGRSIRAITFAHPATVNANLANRAGLGKVPLVLSIVLGSDIIPRCGHGQARELRRVLGGLSRVRRRKGAAFVAEKEDDDDRIHIVTSWWRWKSIQRKQSAATMQERELAKRIEDDLWRLRCDVENDLYAAVKRRSMTASEETPPKLNDEEAEGEQAAPKRHVPPSPWIGPSQRAKAPLHQLTARRQVMDAITLQNEESISASGVLVPAGQSILIHKASLYRITSPLSFFSLPDFHVSAQTTAAEAVCSLLTHTCPYSPACLRSTFPLPTRRRCWRTSSCDTHVPPLLPNHATPASKTTACIMGRKQ